MPTFFNSITGPVWLVALTALFSSAVHASPVQVLECGVLRTSGAVPAVYVDLRFTFRRHIVAVSPFEVLENEYWAQGLFANNGHFDVTAYPIDGEPITDRSTSTQTTILDGKINFGDSYTDEALTMNKSVGIEGWTLESANVILHADDGNTLDDHTHVPEVIDRDTWDPYICEFTLCPVECSVTWDAPGDGVECAVGQSGSGTGICPTGTYIGRITGISYEDHEAEHGAPFAINAGLNDAWVTAQAPYQGLFVTVYEDLGLVFVAWFTFDTAAQQAETTAQSLQSGLPAVFGAEDQRWVTAVGAYSGNQASLNLELTTGGLFNASEPVPTQDTDYGTLDLEFSDCSNGMVTFDVPSAGLSGSFPITRVLEENAALCEELTNP